MRLAVFLSLAFALTSQVFAGLVPFNSHDIESIIGIVSGEVVFESLLDAYYAAETFSILKRAPPTHAQQICDYSKAELDAEVLPWNLFYASRIGDVFGCPLTLSQSDEAVLTSSLGANASLLSAYYGLRTLAKHKAALPEEMVGSTLLAVKGLMDNDGSFRFFQDDEVASLGAAGLAYEMLAEVKSAGYLMGRAGEAAFQEIVDTIPDLFGLSEEHEGLREFPGDEDDEESPALLATSRVVCGAVKLLQAGVSLSLPVDDLREIADFLLNEQALTVSESFHLSSALSCLEVPQPGRPLVLSLETKFLPTGAPQTIKVSVTTVFGNAAPPCTVTLLPSNGPKPLVSSPIAFKADETEYSLTLPQPVDMGSYTLNIRATPNNPKEAAATQSAASLLVRGTATISVVTVTVLENDASGDLHPVASLTLNPSSHSPPEELPTISPTRPALTLSFSVTCAQGKPFMPHQVMLRLTSPGLEGKDGGTQVLFPATLQAQGLYSVKALLPALFQLLKGVTEGKYSASLLIGDRLISNSKVYELGFLGIIPGEDMGPIPLGAEAKTAGPLPEIHHQFKAAEPKPLQWLSIAFTGLSLAPLFVLIVGLWQLGIDTRAFPKELLSISANLGMHAGFTAIMSLYVIYWWKWNLMRTLPLLGILCLFTYFSGLKTLRDLGTNVKTM